MERKYFLGVDGGASKCKLRLENEAGQLIAEAMTGPANIRISVEQAWQSIRQGLEQMSKQHSLSLQFQDLHVGIGIAGCELNQAYQAFLSAAPQFASLRVHSDAYTACLAAHQGKSGAIIIAGTGVIACQYDAGQWLKIGGLGFPHDDEGGGAWLGLQALKKTLKSLDGRQTKSMLSKAVFDFFSNDYQRLVTWANQANSSQYAELAPIVIELAKKHEPEALVILRQAASFVEQLASALLRQQRNITSPLPLCLIGSVALQLKPYLNPVLQQRISDAYAPPEMGALHLVRREEEKC